MDNSRFEDALSKGRDSITRTKNTQTKCLAALRKTKEELCAVFDKAETELTEYFTKTLEEQEVSINRYEVKLKPHKNLDWDEPLDKISQAIKLCKQALSGRKVIEGEMESKLKQFGVNMENI